MKTYIEVVFEGISPQVGDMLVAELAEMGYYGFLEEEGLMKAYIDEVSYDAQVAADLADRHDSMHSINRIEEENWNATWESSFSPVIVNNFVAVRADFHSIVEDIEYEIIITPKMSFGTGHHATTYLVMEAMKEMFGGESGMWGLHVLDFGTGTGLLAILASKMGAEQVLAIDNDRWSIDNAAENIEMNGCGNIELALAGEIPVGKTYDLILANINKHILLANAGAITNALNEGGVVLLSGILVEDVDDIERAYESYLGKPVNVAKRNNWIMMALSKGDKPQG
jgi:ribosomal protein L11 methyltransferase